MGKKSQSKKGKPQYQHNQDSDNQIQDPQAWGSAKQNYYQEGDEQYSQVSEQEQQAKRIYESQHRLLNDPSLYGIGHLEQKKEQMQDEDQDEEQENEQKGISKEYLLGEIEWALQCQSHLQTVNEKAVTEKIRNLYKKIIDMYLVIAITLKEYDIPYIQHHPLLEQLATVKSYLLKVRKRVYNSQKQYKPSAISKYEEIKKKQLQQKLQKQHVKNQQKNKVSDEKAKVNQNKNKKIKKAAFQTVQETQGRLASQMILKNKGLMKKRKKTEGNSRVKLRKKFEKAQSKQRALGHFIRQNPGRQYEGQTNIRYGKIASIKLK